MKKILVKNIQRGCVVQHGWIATGLAPFAMTEKNTLKHMSVARHFVPARILGIYSPAQGLAHILGFIANAVMQSS